MPAPYPLVIPQAFASVADPPNRNTIPDAPLTAQRASWQLGFPPQTMTPVVAGGKPMLGPDMNGVLYMMSTHVVYQQTGQPYRYNADVVVAIGGYAVGTLLGSADGSTLWYNTLANNTADPDAITTVPNGWVAMYSYGITTISNLIGGVRTLNLSEASKSIIILAGALAANQQVVLPNQQRRWLIVNTCTGGFSTTVRTAAGSGVIVPQGGPAAPVEVWCNGTHIYNVVAPVNLPIDQNATPLTIVQRTNAGYVNATYFNQSSGLENLTMTAVYFDIGDGYHRKIPIVNFKSQIFAGAALTGNSTALTQAPGENSTTIATTAFVKSSSLGHGQAWAALTGARAFNVPYVNDTGRPIQVNIDYLMHTPNFGTISAVVGGNFAAGTSWALGVGNPNQHNFMTFIVPPGATYIVTTSGGGSAPSLSNWSELR